jgi:hypothetical protein
LIIAPGCSDQHGEPAARPLSDLPPPLVPVLDLPDNARRFAFD